MDCQVVLSSRHKISSFLGSGFRGLRLRSGWIVGLVVFAMMGIWSPFVNSLAQEAENSSSSSSSSSSSVQNSSDAQGTDALEKNRRDDSSTQVTPSEDSANSDAVIQDNNAIRSVTQRVETTRGSLKIHALQRGYKLGHRLIFIHGTPGDAEAWRTYMENPTPMPRLSGAVNPEDWTLISVDRLGFGQSDPDEAVERLSDQAIAVAAFFDPSEGAQNYLIGHSYGVPVALKVAAMFPKKVNGLLLISGSFSPEFEKIYFFQKMVLQPVIKWMLPRAIVNSSQELQTHAQELRILHEELPNIQSPIVALHGRNDGLVPYRNSLLIKEKFPENQVEVQIDDNGHLVIWVDRPAVDQALVDMVTRAENWKNR